MKSFNITPLVWPFKQPLVVEEFGLEALVDASTRGLGAVLEWEDGELVSLAPGFSFYSTESDSEDIAHVRKVGP